MLQINILTLFPEMFEGPFQESMLKRAQDPQFHQGHPPVSISVINIRDFATDKHHTTDDHPYGGGAGMVMKVEPIARALTSLKIPNSNPPDGGQISKQNQNSNIKNTTSIIDNSKIVLTSAKGKMFTQAVAKEYSELQELTIICGHYEGVDQRVIDHLIDEEVRIGDYVLTGGEQAAIVISDAVTRLLPGVLGNDESLLDESHSEPGFFAHPQYTRPAEYNGWKVPDVLLQGNHQEIMKWRKER